MQRSNRGYARFVPQPCYTLVYPCRAVRTTPSPTFHLSYLPSSTTDNAEQHVTLCTTIQYNTIQYAKHINRQCKGWHDAKQSKHTDYSLLRLPILRLSTLGKISSLRETDVPKVRLVSRAQIDALNRIKAKLPPCSSECPAQIRWNYRAILHYSLHLPNLYNAQLPFPSHFPQLQTSHLRGDARL